MQTSSVVARERSPKAIVLAAIWHRKTAQPENSECYCDRDLKDEQSVVDRNRAAEHEPSVIPAPGDTALHGKTTGRR